MPRRGGRGGMPRNGGASSYKGTVRWESAKPIQEAMKTPLPDIFANHYVISVNGIPVDRRRADDEEDNDSKSSRDDQRFEDLKQSTTLQAKGKELVQAGVVQHQVSSGSTILFGFSHDLELSKDDKDVVFQTRLGRYEVKARFEPKEMVYHNSLAL
jgi:hypothetical protein